MRRKMKLAIATGAVVVASASLGVGIAAASGTGDDAPHPIQGSALERASAAALAHTGEGRVTETEVGDEDSMYEVEVTLDNGRQVDVQLDADFAVVKVMRDHEGG